MIAVEQAKSFETVLEVVEGMQFDRGYISPYFVTNANKMRVELEEPYLLIYEKKLSPSGTAAVARCGYGIEQAASRHCRERRGRSAHHSGGQQAARQPQGCGDQGAWLRRPRQGAVAGYCDSHRRTAICDELGIKLEKSASSCLAGPRKSSSKRTTSRSSRGAARRPRSRRASRKSRRKSTRRRPTTISKSCKSGSPSLRAASR